MSFQYTYDTNGKAVGVFIPINEWEKLEVKTKSKKIKKSTQKSPLFRGIEKGMREVVEIHKGKLQAIPIQQLLDEL